MPKVTIICYLSSLLFYILGYSKMLILNAGHVNTYDFTIYVSQATGYFVLTIFLAVFGSLLFYIKTTKVKEIKIIARNLDLKCPKGTHARRRAS